MFVSEPRVYADSDDPDDVDRSSFASAEDPYPLQYMSEVVVSVGIGGGEPSLLREEINTGSGSG